MEIAPFKGIRFSPENVGDLGLAICPPYDIIGPAEQRLYYERSNYNVVRLECPTEGANSGHDRYQVAASIFRQWLSEGILKVDDLSSFYLHEHRFAHLGEMKIRRGLIARVKLEPWGKGIYPHEETSSWFKSDRLNLLRACQANFSPLLALYQDCKQKIVSVLSQVSQGKPLVEISVPSSGEEITQSKDGEVHILWAITDPRIQQELIELFASQILYIADGHHRYESALVYYQEELQGGLSGYGTGSRAIGYVMMELVEFSDPGLVILPIHRVVRGLPPSVLARLPHELEKFFSLEIFPWEAQNFRLPPGGILGIWGLLPNSLVVLRTRKDAFIGSFMPVPRSRVYREFNVSILNHVILENMLKCNNTAEVAYTVDVEQACEGVNQGIYQLAFLLSAPSVELVKAIAQVHDRMPPKSTYFYPKVPAGLVINPLNELS